LSLIIHSKKEHHKKQGFKFKIQKNHLSFLLSILQSKKEHHTGLICSSLLNTMQKLECISCERPLLKLNEKILIWPLPTNYEFSPLSH